MKKFLVLAGLALLVSSPAMARSQHKTVAPAQSVNDPATANAYSTPVYGAYGSQYGNPPGHVVVGGVDQGTDPDSRVRLMLQMDPPYGAGS